MTLNGEILNRMLYSILYKRARQYRAAGHLAELVHEY